MGARGSALRRVSVSYSGLRLPADRSKATLTPVVSIGELFHPHTGPAPGSLDKESEADISEPHHRTPHRLHTLRDRYSRRTGQWAEAIQLYLINCTVYFFKRALDQSD